MLNILEFITQTQLVRCKTGYVLNSTVTTIAVQTEEYLIRNLIL